jgi:hypothetical protein
MTDIDALEAAHKATTQGEWSGTVDDDGENVHILSGDKFVIAGCGCCGSPYTDIFNAAGNVAFIALAHKELPGLIAEVRQLRAERDALREMVTWLPKLLHEISPDLNNIVRAIEDEGDRCYLGSTNHADELREIANWLDRKRARAALESGNG